jgi:hypothetical protein
VADIVVRALSESEFDTWSEVLDDSPQGSIYALPEYLDTLCSAAGGRFRVIGAFQNDRLVGGLPLYERDSLEGAFVEPRLLLYYNGPVLRAQQTRYPSEATARQLKILDALQQYLAGSNYATIRLQCAGTLLDVRVFIDAGWTAWPSYTYIAPIHDLAVLRSRVEQNLRRLIDRCDRAGFQFDEDGDFDRFYQLHTEAMQRYNVAPYLPYDAFRTYFERLHSRGLCRLYHARSQEGESVAVQLVLLGPGALSYTVAAAADRAHMRSGASAFLRWKAFESLHRLGFKGNDLTGGGLGSVTHFKAQLGGDLVPCFVLDSAPTLRTRAIQRTREAYRYARRSAGRVVRLVRKRSKS